MYLLLALSLISFIVCSIAAWAWRKESEVWGAVIGIFFFSSIINVMIYCALSAILMDVYGNWTTPVVNNIISMTSSNTAEGSFTLGTGTIRECRYYIYRIQKDDGAIIEGRTPVDNAAIYEVDDQKPHIEYFEKYLSHKISYITIKSEYYVKFYVPKGTVIRDFKVQ